MRMAGQMDIVVLAIVVVFFLVSLALVSLLDRL